MSEQNISTEEENRRRLEREADFLLRQSGFEKSGAKIPGAQAKQRRRDAAIRTGKTPNHFDPFKE